jgi:hypothetical protein
METKKYKISSAADFWEPFTVEVDKKGYISGVEFGSSIVIGSLFKSMCDFWNSFTGENAYIIEEVKGDSKEV